ncbi:MAG: ester cyclase [Dehalococcoidia bacterium]|nr:ester cyclase [Dehalococcoidia bacterium]
MEDNKARYQRFMDEVVNKGNFGVFDELVSNDFVDHTPRGGVDATREGFRQTLVGFREAFPDLNSQVELYIAEGDKVAAVHRTTGTHQGELMGMPPTGQAFEITEVHVVRVVEGKAVEHWSASDDVGMLTQLGLLPVSAG